MHTFKGHPSQLTWQTNESIRAFSLSLSLSLRRPCRKLRSRSSFSFVVRFGVEYIKGDCHPMRCCPLTHSLNWPGRQTLLGRVPARPRASPPSRRPIKRRHNAVTRKRPKRIKKELRPPSIEAMSCFLFRSFRIGFEGFLDAIQLQYSTIKSRLVCVKSP